MIYIQLIFAFILIIEAIHDSYVIALQDYRHYRYEQLSKGWHIASSIQYTITVAVIAYLCSWWPLFIALLFLRSSIFPMSLNFLRGKPIFYLSDKGFDGTIKKILGKYAGSILMIGSLIIIVIINKYL